MRGQRLTQCGEAVGLTAYRRRRFARFLGFESSAIGAADDQLADGKVRPGARVSHREHGAVAVRRDDVSPADDILRDADPGDAPVVVEPGAVGVEVEHDPERAIGECFKAGGVRHALRVHIEAGRRAARRQPLPEQPVESPPREIAGEGRIEGWQQSTARTPHRQPAPAA